MSRSMSQERPPSPDHPSAGDAAEGPRRTFLIVAHRAEPSGLIPLQDLAGGAGRWDLLVRCVQSALLVSHGIRHDTTIHLMFQKDPQRPRVLSVYGDRVRNLHPDERAGAALLAHALVKAEADRGKGNKDLGIEVRDLDLAGLLAGAPGLILLSEDGPATDLGAVPEGQDGPSWYVLGDNSDLTPQETALVRAHPRSLEASLGPRSLQAPQCITLVHDRLDRGVPSR